MVDAGEVGEEGCIFACDPEKSDGSRAGCDVSKGGEVGEGRFARGEK